MKHHPDDCCFSAGDVFKVGLSIFVMSFVVGFTVGVIL